MNNILYVIVGLLVLIGIASIPVLIVFFGIKGSEFLKKHQSIAKFCKVAVDAITVTIVLIALVVSSYLLGYTLFN